MFDKGDQRPTMRARELHNNATPAERRMWSAISARKLGGARFNRQFPIGPFICDFICRSAGLIIELDGQSHDQAQGYDAARTRFLENYGFRVLRFTNSEVMGNLDSVLAAIEVGLSHGPSPNPSRKREGDS